MSNLRNIQHQVSNGKNIVVQLYVDRRYPLTFHSIFFFYNIKEKFKILCQYIPETCPLSFLVLVNLVGIFDCVEKVWFR